MNRGGVRESEATPDRSVAACFTGVPEIVQVHYPEHVATICEFVSGRECAWLDGWSPTGAALGFSLICIDPECHLLIRNAGEPAESYYRAELVDSDAELFTLWRKQLAGQRRSEALPWPIGPGWVGYLGFELSRTYERVRSRGTRPGAALPLARLAYFPNGIVLDHARRQAFAVSSGRLPRELLARWEAACHAPCVESPAPRLRAERELTRAAYRAMIERALEYIRAGDIYQVNLAQRLRLIPTEPELATGLAADVRAGGRAGGSIDLVRDSAALYRALRQVNPAPYGGLLRWADGALASVSPELMLSLEDGWVRTRPIKGTRPRSGVAAQDERQVRELMASSKERAELAMIVDLHRNDLGRVCEIGSVRVAQPRQLETHPTVFHTVADIVGRLAEGRSALDLLAACLPAGSVSGVPKLRALEIIDELEPVARGAYCGALGVLSIDGRMVWNVAIRTLQVAPCSATLSLGGGIVAESDPEQEFAETLAKGRGILRALGCLEPPEID